MTSPDPRDSLPERDIRPVAPLPRARLTGTGIAIICGVFGAGLFFVLDSNRKAPAATPSGQLQGSIASPPPLVVPRAAPEAPDIEDGAIVEPAGPSAMPYPPQPTFAQSPAPSYAPVYSSPAPPVEEARLAPARAVKMASSSTDDAVLLMDISPGDVRVSNATAGGAAPTAEQPAADEQAVRASVIRNRSSLVPQGTLIAAVLETPVHSSRAGLSRAVVSKDVRGFDSTRILIPRGSRLIGEAQGGTQAGQKRVLVNWTRLIRPDGVAIRIGSPAADRLGGAGIKGSVNSHFFERFGNAVLQSALQIGINRASRNVNDSIYLNLPNQAGNAVSQIPIFNPPTGPSISIAQGTEISIFVAKDLDFGAVGAR